MKTNMELEDLKGLIRDIPNFPSKGIIFRDLTTLLKNGEALHLMGDKLADLYRGLGVTKVVGIESRGFIGGSVLAYELGCGFVPARKPGKLPAVTIKKAYAKEYGVDTIELHSDAINSDDIVVIHDDLLATGGTMRACYDLVKSMNPKKVYINFVVELTALHGRDNLPEDCEVTSLLKY
jgi:adenine phosphoribosyltransferase